MVVLADDLTGAAEIVGICLRHGVRVEMIIDVPDQDRLMDFKQTGISVLVIAGDTRSSTLEGACRINRVLAENLHSVGISQIFKKIDSVLRGWVLPELAVLATSTGKTSLHIQPANPQAGRCIQKGKYYIAGIELSQTAFARDPEFPALSSEVRDLLNERLLDKSALDHLPFVIPDACEVDDLRQSALQCGAEVLPAGSAAFWESYLLVQIEQKKILPSSIRPTSPEISMDNFLLICGSAHQYSLDYAEELARKGIRLMEMPSELTGEQKPDSAVSAAWMNACVEAWEQEPRLVLRIASQAIHFENSADMLKARFTEVLHLLLQQIKPAELFIEGGATAYSLLNRLKWTLFTPVNELAPGVVRLQLNQKPCIFVSLKPGSYTWPNFLFNH